MLKSFKLSVGDVFISNYPIKTGPEYEKVSGHVKEIHLAASKVTIENPTNGNIWVISLEDAITKNTKLITSFE